MFLPIRREGSLMIVSHLHSSPGVQRKEGRYLLSTCMPETVHAASNGTQPRTSHAEPILLTAEHKMCLFTQMKTRE